MPSQALFNPFPGLRSFEPDEDHLFFGREKEIDSLLRRLRTTRFLSVVGNSGSGKSSLVRSGLIPSLFSGFMVQAGSNWRVAKFRPGEDPIGQLAGSLCPPDVLGTNPDLADTQQVLVEATLRRGTRGLAEVVRQARIPSHHNILVVVDQFEELFRFRRSRQMENSKDEALAFVKLLLEGSQQNEFPIYVVLTMRSDFIGDCMDYPGLAEAVNAGQFLVPRMTRDELKLAITGPVAVAGGRIASRLVMRLLNDLGDDQDQLPVLQHALMRTWNYYSPRADSGQSMDIPDYEAVGTLRHALSIHADEAYQETGPDHRRRTAERMFKALTDTFADPRGVRRPTSIRELAQICKVEEKEIIKVVEIFRCPGRSFLTPLAAQPLDSRSIVDISHESLMRCWTSLIAWAEEERASAAFYARLSQAAAWFEDGTAGLWRDPELELGLQWRAKNQPTAAWAERYNSALAQALEFLRRSEEARDSALAERERERKRKLHQYQWAAGVLAALLLIVAYLAQIARKENERAEMNLHLAQNAVDEMLSSAGRKQARVAEDVPEMEEFRRELLGKARNFYSIFVAEKPHSEELRREMAWAHFRLGDINRLLEKNQEAIAEYQKAIAGFSSLAAAYPHKPDYRQALANSYNWLGETYRTQLETRPEAEKAYQNALRLQQDLVRQNPANGQFRRELARTHYNRGILRYFLGHLDQSESDFQAAIGLLNPLAEAAPASGAAQELARALNDLGNLMRKQNRLAEARGYYERAIRLHEGLLKSEPNNREYKQELATFCNNLALLLLDQRQLDLAVQRNRQALSLIEELASPAPSLATELAGAHNLRCQMLEIEKSDQAEAECRESFDIIEGLLRAQGTSDHPRIQLLLRDLGYNYLDLARNGLASGQPEMAQSALDKVAHLLPELTEQDRRVLTPALRNLQSTLNREMKTRHPGAHGP
jgi:tetratricopeptide (TPR) repeat protein